MSLWPQKPWTILLLISTTALSSCQSTSGGSCPPLAQYSLAQQRAVAAERERLLKERDEAFDAGDRETFQRAEQELRKVETVATPAVPDETLSFVERNASWFQKDTEATTWAVNRTEELAKQGFGVARQLAIVEREAKSLFPEFFEAEKPKPKPAPLNAPGARSGAPARKGYASLPDDAKKAADDYARDAMLGGDNDWIWTIDEHALRTLMVRVCKQLRVPMYCRVGADRDTQRRHSAIDALAAIDDVIDQCAARHARRLRENGAL